jgi:hypothetical protein
MTRMPARAAQNSKLDRAREVLDLPDENDLAAVRSTDADYRRNKTGPYGGAPETRETPKPRQPNT